MLSELFGSQTTESCLLYLIGRREGYALEIAKAYGISNTQVTRTLSKLEDADILVGVNRGRTRVFSLNPKWHLAPELKQLLQKALLQIPIEAQEVIFSGRTKPRKKAKAK